MKGKLLPLLLLTALCLGLLAGCGSSQPADGGSNPTLSGTTGKQVETNETNKLAAPEPYTVPGTEPYLDGYYYSSVDLFFDGSAYESGKLYVLIDRNEAPEDVLSKSSDEINGLFVREYPSDWDFTIPLYNPGSHTVRAFVGEEDAVASEIFEGTYDLYNYDFDDFTFSWTPGQYMAPIPLSFKGTQSSGAVYYTLDGSDPLSFNENGIDWDGAIKLKDERMMLPRGTTVVTARYVSSDHFVSPIITAKYEVSKPFDTASIYVDEDFEFDYVQDPEHGIRLYNKASGEYTQMLGKYKVDQLAALSVTYRPDLVDSGTMPAQAIVEAQQQRQTATAFYFRTWDGDHNKVYFRHGSISGDLDFQLYAKNIERVGVGWYRTTGKNGDVSVKWRSAEYETGTEELAIKARLMLDDIALYTARTDEAYAVMSCDLDGENEQILWANEERPVLDAMTDKIILYHTGDGENTSHMIYDRATGEHRENAIVPVNDHTTLLGYTSDAVYVRSYMGVNRTVIDYDAL